jgi:hypothetical protein
MIYPLQFTDYARRAAVVAPLLLTLNFQPSALFAQGGLATPGAPVPAIKFIDLVGPYEPNTIR